jgi:DNA primase
MARIRDEALERLKREVSVARLIEAQGLKLIVQGKDLACRCPWHEGMTPELHRDEDDA